MFDGGDKTYATCSAVNGAAGPGGAATYQQGSQQGRPAVEATAAGHAHERRHTFLLRVENSVFFAVNIALTPVVLSCDTALWHRVPPSETTDSTAHISLQADSYWGACTGALTTFTANPHHFIRCAGCYFFVGRAPAADRRHSTRRVPGFSVEAHRCWGHACQLEHPGGRGQFCATRDCKAQVSTVAPRRPSFETLSKHSNAEATAHARQLNPVRTVAPHRPLFASWFKIVVSLQD